MKQFMMRLVERWSVRSKVCHAVSSIAVLVLLAAALLCCNAPEQGHVTIGAVLPLTGSGAPYGESARNGIALAVEEINGSGGIAGKKLAVVFEDSQSSPSNGVTAYRKLLEVNGVPATLTEFSPVVMACAPIANERKSVLLNCGAQTPKVRAGGPYLFSAIPDANEEAVQMADFTYNVLGLHTVATFAMNTETGVATTEIFVKRFTELGGRIIAQERHDQGATDFRSQLTKLKVQAPPAVYMISLSRESALILKQAMEMGFRTQWLSYTSFQAEEILSVAKEAGEGVIYSYPKFDPAASQKAEAFEKAYSRRFSRQPEVYAATFYDGVRALKAAMDREGVSGEAIRKGLSTAVYEGVAGPIDFRNSTWVSKPLQFKIVKDGKFAIYK